MGRAFKINVDMREVDIAIRQINQYDQQTQNNLASTVEHSTSNIKMGVLRRIPIRTGALAKRLSSKFDRNKLTGTVSIRSPLAHLIEFGAKGALEKPKKWRALNIKGSYRAKANIPARPARPMMRPAWEDEKPNFVSNIEEALKKS